MTLCLAAACGAPSSPPPRLEVAESVRELGSLRRGNALQANFPLRNGGGQDLRIERLRAGCGCIATANPPTVPPGATATIEARCDTDYDSGAVKRTLTLYTNDPEKPFFTLAMNATVAADAAAQPAKVYAGPVRRGQELAFETRVRAGRPVGAPLPGGRVVAATFEPSVPGGAEGRLRLRIKDDAPLGRFSEVVVLPVPGSSDPPLRVPVVGTVGEGAG